MYGQMGVAGDGNKQLEKMDITPTLAKSKMMSAKNAWGTELTHTHSRQTTKAVTSHISGELFVL